MVVKHNLPPIEAVYSSPLLRCCMTAAEAIIGYEEEVSKKNNENGTHNLDSDADAEVNVTVKSDQHLKVTVENGLVESLNKNWYTSWCLKDSDGTWGGREGYQNSANDEDDLEISIDPRARDNASTLLLNAEDIATFLSNYDGCMEDDSSSILSPYKSLSSMINVTEDYHDKEVAGMMMVESMKDSPYTWGKFETRNEQQDRVENVVCKLSNRHSHGTILLLSHGGPVTHLYERLINDNWKSHGISSYTCFSIYQQKNQAMEEHEHAVSKDVSRDNNHSEWIPLVVNDSSHLN